MKLIKKLVAGVSFLGGKASDGEPTSGFFKLQKICTLKKDMPRKSFFISFIFILFILSSNPAPLLAQNNTIQIDLDVSGCNNNGICESGENAISCPVDCAIIVPPPHGGGGGGLLIPPDNIYIYDLAIQPNFTDAFITWKSSKSTISTIRWGQTSEVKEGTLKSVVFALDHKMQIINLKSGTLYYFTIESQDVNGKTNLYPPVYFFTKFLKDTTFPLAPRKVKASAEIPGITLTWENPPDPNFSYVRIMRHEDRFRGDPFWGKLIYEGPAEKFLDKEVTPGKKYYYVLFARDTHGDFSSGIGASAIAYTPKEILPPPPIEETPPEIFISETFFVHQYNQLVEPLTSVKTNTIENNKDTVVDLNSKTLPDDLLEVTDKEGKVVGQYLFSFNKDSGRYQSVIPPIEKSGNYEVKIYRYKDNIKTEISAGSLLVHENLTPKIDKSSENIFLNFLNNYLYWILSIFSIILFLFLLILVKRRRQNIQ